MWFLSGLLVGIGVVGLLTGLPFAALGVFLAFRQWSHKRRDPWLFLVGAGLGAALLTLDDVRKFNNDQCIGEAGRGFHCPASGAHEIFWIGVVSLVLGLLAAAIARLRPTKPTNSPPEIDSALVEGYKKLPQGPDPYSDAAARDSIAAEPW